MAYDEDLAERIRELVGSESPFTERKMFGGLAVLIETHAPTALPHGCLARYASAVVSKLVDAVVAALAFSSFSALSICESASSISV
jgi:hypothetical protein